MNWNRHLGSGPVVRIRPGSIELEALAACIADSSYVCEVVLDATKIYYTNRAPIVNQTINTIKSYAYAQIALPWVPFDWSTSGQQVVTLKIRSSVSGQSDTASFSEAPCAIKTTYTTVPGYSSSNGLPSVISGPQPEQTPSGTPNFNIISQWTGLHVIFDGVDIITPTNPALTGMDLRKVWAVEVPSMKLYAATSGYTLAGPALPTNPAATGFTSPPVAPAGSSTSGTWRSPGTSQRSPNAELFTAKRLGLYANRIAMEPFGGGHSAQIGRVSAALTSTSSPPRP